MSRDLRKEANESLRTAANAIDRLHNLSDPADVWRALRCTFDALCLVAAIVGVPNAIDQRNDNRGPMGDRDHDGRPNAYDGRDDRWDPTWGREVRAPKHWGQRQGWNRHVRACMSRYRSYNPRTGTYTGYDGLQYPCP